MDNENYNQYLSQSQLQRESSAQQAAYYAPQLQEQMQQNQAVLIGQINPNNLFQEVELILRNQEKTIGNKIISKGKPLMNDEGISKFLANLKAAVTQNTVLSNLDEKTIGKITLQLSNNFVDLLALNCERFEIDKADLDIVADLFMTQTYSALMRGFGQGEKNFLKGITVESINGGGNLPRPKRSGFWDKFKIGS